MDAAGVSMESSHSEDFIRQSRQESTRSFSDVAIWDENFDTVRAGSLAPREESSSRKDDTEDEGDEICMKCSYIRFPCAE